MITVLVVDDHELVRTGICRMLEDHADVQVIGQAESGEEAINLVRQHHPNVVLLDVNMPGIGGVETTRRLLQTAPETKVLAVSGLAECKAANISALILLNNWPVLICLIHKPHLLMLCLNVKCRWR